MKVVHVGSRQRPRIPDQRKAVVPPPLKPGIRQILVENHMGYSTGKAPVMTISLSAEPDDFWKPLPEIDE